MKVFFDTEFIDTGNEVHLISIGMVREDGSEYYAELDDAPLEKACDWVKQNVIPFLNGKKKSREQVAKEIQEFVGKNPEMWGYFVAYDWLCLCQLYGRMLDTPYGWRQWPHDVMWLREKRMKAGKLKHTGIEHNALDDARWTKQFYEYLVKQPLDNE